MFWLRAETTKNEKSDEPMTTMTKPERSAEASAQLEPVRLWQRGAARGIDTALVGLPLAAIINATVEQITVGLVVAVLLAVYLYETLAVSRFGTTVGKSLLGLAVVDHETGGRLASSKAGTRILSVLAIAGAVQLFVPIGPAVAVFLWGSAVTDPDGRGVADRLAGSRVVRASARRDG